MRNRTAAFRLTLTLFMATTVLAGCVERHVERRTVYRDGPRYSARNDDPTFRRGRSVCDADKRVCYQNGWPNRGVTRQVFGRNAVRQGR